MNKIIYRSMLALSFAITITACQQQDLTVSYLAEHPRVLERELQRCMTDPRSSQLSQCKVAIEAQGILRGYLEQAQTDPEGFGQRILDVQMNMATIKTEMATSDQASAKMAELKKTYDDKQKEVSILLAVAGLNSPE